MSFNFANFKKVAEDDKTVTMAHENGHQMRIIKSAIPRLQREQLKMLPLAKGGEVEGISTQGKDVRNAKKAKAKGRDGDAVMDMEFAKEEAKGRADHERMVKPKMKGLSEGGKVKYYSEAGDVQADDQNSVDQPPQAAPAPVTVNVQAPAAQPAAQPVQAVAPMQAALPAIKQPQVAPAAAPITASSGVENQSENTLQGIQQGQEAIKSQQAIDAAKAQNQLPIEEEALKAQQQRARVQTQAFNDFQKHGSAAIEKMANGEVDPNHFYNNRSTGERIGSTIGLMLGGFGTAFGGHNFAYDKLQADINRDVDAQKANAHIRNNVWSAYKDLYGYAPVADNLTKATLLDTAAQQARVQALKLGTPQAIQAAQAATAKFAADSHQLRTEAASITASRVPPLSQNKGPAKKGSENEHILSPNANEMEKTVGLNPLYKPYASQIAEQKTKAAMSDEAIDAINEVFPKLQQNVGGVGGYIRRKAHLLSGVPLIGHAAEGLGEFATDVPENQSFDSDISRVTGAVRGALQGNVSDELLDQVIRKNTPEIQDTPELAQKKLYNLKQFIKEHTRKDLLQMSKLAK